MFLKVKKDEKKHQKNKKTKKFIKIFVFIYWRGQIRWKRLFYRPIWSFIVNEKKVDFEVIIIFFFFFAKKVLTDNIGQLYYYSTVDWKQKTFNTQTGSKKADFEKIFDIRKKVKKLALTVLN